MAAGRKTKTDPELMRQLESAESSDASVQAVFSLDLPMKQLIDPDLVEKTTYQVIDRVGKLAGCKPEGVSVFRNLGSFAVSAEPTFIRKLIDDPGIAKAVANKQPRSQKKARA